LRLGGALVGNFSFACAAHRDGPRDERFGVPPSASALFFGGFRRCARPLTPRERFATLPVRRWCLQSPLTSASAPSSVVPPVHLPPGAQARSGVVAAWSSPALPTKEECSPTRLPHDAHAQAHRGGCRGRYRARPRRPRGGSPRTRRAADGSRRGRQATRGAASSAERGSAVRRTGGALARPPRPGARRRHRPTCEGRSRTGAFKLSALVL